MLKVFDGSAIAGFAAVSPQVQAFKINVYECCLRWRPADRRALLASIRCHSGLKRVEVTVSSGPPKERPAPCRSFMFALELLHASQSNSGISSVKVELDMSSLSFTEASDFLHYASPSISELSATHLFHQKITNKVLKDFVDALKPLKEKKCSQMLLVNVEEPITILEMDVVAVSLLSQSLDLLPQSPTKLRLHIKKTCPVGIKALSCFLETSESIETLYLGLDGKLAKGLASDQLLSVLHEKKLLASPDHSTTSPQYIFPVTTIFLQGSDGDRVVVGPDILSKNSPYFQVLFSGKFAETQNIVTLPGCDSRALQALVVFFRYGHKRHLDIPTRPWYSDEQQFVAMATMAHLARYLVIPGLLPKIYKLARERLGRFPKLAFLALRIFRDQSAQSKSIPKVLERLALMHVQNAEVHLLRDFFKKCKNLNNARIKELSDMEGDLPQIHRSLGKISDKANLQYKGLREFLELVEVHVNAGYLDPKLDLVTSTCKDCLLTSETVQESVNQLSCLNHSTKCACNNCTRRNKTSLFTRDWLSWWYQPWRNLQPP